MEHARKVIPLFGDRAARPHSPEPASQSVPSNRLLPLQPLPASGRQTSVADRLHALVDSLTEENQACLLILAGAWATKFEACDRRRRAP